MTYNPKDYKYGSQAGTILKRCYPGIVKICDENGTVVAKRAALSWNDYTWKRHEIGLSHARAVKREFWVKKTNYQTLSFDLLVLISDFTIFYICRMFSQLAGNTRDKLIVI